MIILPKPLAARTYLLWFLWVSLAFFGVYPACNWLTAQRASVYSLYFPFELQIPFVPEMIWGYFSMYVLFFFPVFLMDAQQLRKLGARLVSGTMLSGAIFLLLPSQLGFQRISPAEAPYSWMFDGMFSLDLPYNMAPSLHVVYTGLILFILIESARSTAAKAAWLGWLTIVCISTILVHQHHLVDVFMGLGMVWALHKYAYRGSHA